MSKVRPSSSSVAHLRQIHPRTLYTPDIAFATSTNWMYENSSISPFPIVLGQNSSRTFPTHKTLLPSCSKHMNAKLGFVYCPDLSHIINNTLCITEETVWLEWWLLSMTVEALSNSLQPDSAGTKPPCTYWTNCSWTIEAPVYSKTHMNVHRFHKNRFYMENEFLYCAQRLAVDINFDTDFIWEENSYRRPSQAWK